VNEDMRKFPGRNFPSLDRRRLLQGAAVLAAAPLLALLPRAAAAAKTLTAQDQEDVQRVEDYLNGLTTMQARFQQFSEQGGLAHGRIYLRRPGRVRVEYEPPVPVLLVSDGTMVTYYDSELDQRNQVPLSSSPLWFLLRPNVRLNRDVTITDVQRAPGGLKMSMFQSDEPDAGTVTLVFRDPPLQLMHWYLKDAQGQEIQVALFDTAFDVEISNNLFATPRTHRQQEGGGGDR
jgi:outer membrane lipoprotein-sorting protein